ncbi:MAG: enoyl-CoA hydratase-related protein [Polyangiales bacterium]
MSKDNPILATRDAMVATIELHNPPYNQLHMALIDRLEEVIEEVAEDKSIRVVVLKGAGGQNFSVGADITEFGAVAAKRGVREFIEQRHRLIRRIETMPKPVVCAMRGSCIGGGLEIALGCHFRIAASGGKIGLPEIELGVVPAWGGSQRLTRTIGRARALEVMLLARKLTAEEAYAYGFVNEVCAPAELDDRADALARELASKAPLAVAGILESVVRGGEESLTRGLEREFMALEKTASSKDLQEGVMAFLQKRQPNFKGE